MGRRRLRIESGYRRELFNRLVRLVVLFVSAPEVEMRVCRVFRGHKRSQPAVVFDSLREFARDDVQNGLEIERFSFRQRRAVAQGQENFIQLLLRQVVVIELGQGLGQPRARKYVIAVGVNRQLQYLARLIVISIAYELDALVIKPRRGRGGLIRRGTEGAPISSPRHAQIQGGERNQNNQRRPSRPYQPFKRRLDPSAFIGASRLVVDLNGLCAKAVLPWRDRLRFPQIIEQLARRLVTLVRLFSQRFERDTVQFARHLRVEIGRRRRIDVQHLGADFDYRFAVEGRTFRQAFIKHRAQ